MPNCFLRSSTVTNLSQLTDLWSVASQYTHARCVGIVSFVWNVLSAWLLRILGVAFNWIYFLPRLKSLYQLWKVPVLTRSAFIPFSLSSTLSPCISWHVFQFPQCLQRLDMVHELLVKFVDIRRLCPSDNRQIHNIPHVRIHDLASLPILADKDIFCSLIAFCCER